MKVLFVFFNLFVTVLLLTAFFMFYATAGGKDPNEVETKLTFYLFWEMNKEHLIIYMNIIFFLSLINYLISRKVKYTFLIGTFYIFIVFAFFFWHSLRYYTFL